MLRWTDSPWARMYHAFAYDPERFLASYHKRSNVIRDRGRGRERILFGRCHPPRASFGPSRASANCPVTRADASVSSTSGPPGTAVEVSGPLYYLNSEHEVWVPGNDAIQAWWNLDPSDYPSASTAAVQAANGADAAPTESGGELAGDFITNGACSFDLKFLVPDVAAGKYPVSILGVAGSDGSTTVYASFIYEVT